MSSIHLPVILHILAGDDVGHPVPVVQVPPDGFGHALLEGVGGGPAQLAGDFGVVDGVAAVVAGAVLHIFDEGFRFAKGGQNQPHDFDVGLFVVAADVVNLAIPAFMQNCINGQTVVRHMEPIPNLHTVAVDGQFLVVQAVVNHQGNQLFRKLIGSVVVAATGDVRGNAKTGNLK